MFVLVVDAAVVDEDQAVPLGRNGESYLALCFETYIEVVDWSLGNDWAHLSVPVSAVDLHLGLPFSEAGNGQTCELLVSRLHQFLVLGEVDPKLESN